jgi:hypothetical protein
MTLRCACGCGLPVTVSSGRQPRFVERHQHRGKPTSHYRKLVLNGELVAVHRLRAELALGKPLPLKAKVHHVDGTKSELSPLVICQNEAYHKLIHARMRVKAAGGNPNNDKICGSCKEVKPKSEFNVCSANFDGLYTVCRSCVKDLSVSYRAKLRSK